MVSSSPEADSTRESDSNNRAGAMGAAEVVVAERPSSANVVKTKEEDDAGSNGTNRGGAGLENVSTVEYKVYKRRWFGLLQLTLLNIIVSWDVREQANPRANILAQMALD